MFEHAVAFASLLPPCDSPPLQPSGNRRQAPALLLVPLAESCVSVCVCGQWLSPAGGKTAVIAGGVQGHGPRVFRVI